MGGDNVFKDEKLIEWSKKFSYPMIIGSVIHSLVHTRPDTAYTVSILSRAMSKPTLHHYKAARCLLVYLRSTRTLGIEYHQERMLENERLVTSAVEDRDQYLEAAVDATNTYEGNTDGFITRTDDVSGLSGSLDYDFRRWLTLQLGYQFEQRQSNRLAIDYDRHLLNLNIRVTL